MKRRIKNIAILFLIIVLAGVLRFYRVTSNPPHLYWDEASIAYNAYSINETGKDEWGNDYPLIFKAFGDYKLPLYIYLTSLSQKIFGLIDFSVRFPSALLGILGVLVILGFCYQLKVGQQRSYLSAFLLAISPWHWQFSRAGFEANLGFFCQFLGLWLFLLAVNSGYGWWLLGAFLFFLLTIFSYHGSAITTFFLVFLMIAVFFRKLGKQSRQLLVLSFIVFVVLVGAYLPKYWVAVKHRVNLTGESFLWMKGNVISNFANNYVANFSLDYLFFRGDQEGRHSVKKMGQLYLWQIFPIFLGIYFLLKRWSIVSTIVFSGLLISALPSALTAISPHALRGLGSVYWWQILSAIGTVLLWRKIRRQKVVSVVFVSIVMYALMLYLHVYFIHYPKAYAADWQDGARQAIQFLNKNKDSYERVYVYKDFDVIYIMLYTPIDPRELHRRQHDTSRLGKFVYFDYSSLPDFQAVEKSLLLVPAWFQYDDNKLLRRINMYGGHTVFKIYEL